MENVYQEIHDWLKYKSRETLLKYWAVVSVIEAKESLSDDPTLRFHTIDFKDIDRNYLIDILTNLHKKKFIFVWKKLNETKQQFPGQPVGAIGIDITDNPDEVFNMYSTQTEIGIEHKFKYLVKVLKDLLSSELKPDYNQTKQQDNNRELELQLPYPWKLEEVNEKGRLTKAGVLIYEFPKTWAQRYKFFKCLCVKYGQHVTYKELYEFESSLDYPKEKITRVNRNIRSTINKLRKKMAKLPITIKTSKGYTLTLQ